MQWIVPVLIVLTMVMLAIACGCTTLDLGSTQVADFGTSEEGKALRQEINGKYGDTTQYNGSARFLESLVTDGLKNNVPQTRVLSVSADTPGIYVWTVYEGFAGNDPVTFEFVKDGKAITSITKNTGGTSGIVSGRFDRPNAGWVPGVYTIVFSGKGARAETTFDIITGASVTKPFVVGDTVTCPAGLYPDGGRCMDNCNPKSTCGNVCADTRTDPNNCGSCGNACSSTQRCSNGKCISGTTCPPGQTSCSGNCVDLRTDHGNCGSCADACSTGEVCSGSRCVPLSSSKGCQSGQTNCDGNCVYLSSDNANCGSCRNECGASHLCTSGICMGMGAIPVTTTPAGQPCWLSATLNRTRVRWGDTVTISGTDTCPSPVKFRLAKGMVSTLPATGCEIGSATRNTDESYQYSWNTGDSEKACTLSSGTYTVFVMTAPEDQYTKLLIEINSAVT